MSNSFYPVTARIRTESLDIWIQPAEQQGNILGNQDGQQQQVSARCPAFVTRQYLVIMGRCWWHHLFLEVSHKLDSKVDLLIFDSGWPISCLALALSNIKPQTVHFLSEMTCSSPNFKHVERTEAGRLDVIVMVTWCSLFYCWLSELSRHIHRKLHLHVSNLLLLWISIRNDTLTSRRGDLRQRRRAGDCL